MVRVYGLYGKTYGNQCLKIMELDIYDLGGIIELDKKMK
jgi:hypothetical protein